MLNHAAITLTTKSEGGKSLQVVVESTEWVSDWLSLTAFLGTAGIGWKHRKYKLKMG